MTGINVKSIIEDRNRKSKKKLRVKCRDCFAPMFIVLRNFDKYIEGDCFCINCSGLLKPIWYGGEE